MSDPINLDTIERDIREGADGECSECSGMSPCCGRDLPSDETILALIARVRALEAGIKEALDGWGCLLDDYGAPDERREAIETRIAELRKLQGDHE